MKKKKRPSVVQKRIPKPETKKLPENQKILNRFLALEQSGWKPDVEDMVRFIAESNAETLGRVAMNLDRDQIGADCLSFYRYLVQHGYLSTALAEAIEENWPWDPLIWRVAFDYEIRLERKLDRYTLSARQKENIRLLIRTLSRIPDWHRVSWTTADGMWDGIEVRDSDPEKALEGEELRGRLTHIARRDGLLFATMDDPKGDKLLMWGVCFEGGEIRALSPEEAARAAEEQILPGGGKEVVFAEVPVAFCAPS